MFDIYAIKWEAVLRIALIFISIVIASLFLIFKAGSIINLLKLDKGFDNQKILIGELKTSKIVNILLISIGLYLFISNLSSFIYYIFEAFSKDLNNQTQDEYNKTYLIICGLNLALGLFVLSNHRVISKWFTKNT